MKNHLMIDPKTSPLTGDLAYFVTCVHGKLSGMIGTYVDDMIMAGDDEFQNESMVTGQVFKTKQSELDSFTLARITVKKEGKNYMLDQESYANRIHPLSSDCTAWMFRGRGHELAWLTPTRPDLCAAVGFLSQVREEKFDKAAVKLANNTIEKA